MQAHYLGQMQLQQLHKKYVQYTMWKSLRQACVMHLIHNVLDNVNQKIKTLILTASVQHEVDTC